MQGCCFPLQRSPSVFLPGSLPLIESLSHWLADRRALGQMCPLGYQTDLHGLTRADLGLSM